MPQPKTVPLGPNTWVAPEWRQAMIHAKYDNGILIPPSTPQTSADKVRRILRANPNIPTVRGTIR